MVIKKEYDEPELINVTRGPAEKIDPQIESEIRDLCFGQPFAVLSTQVEGQPHTNLISFAFNEELNRFVFATPTQTRKYTSIYRNPQVSMLIDNRAQTPDSINLIRVATVNGEARILEDPSEIDQWAALLINRHSYLEKFVKAPSTGLILVEVLSFFYVRRFQEVYQWTPDKSSS